MRTTIRALTLPAGAAIETESRRAAVTANARGDVAPIASVGIVHESSSGTAPDAVITPSGAVYGTAVYPFSGAYSGERTRLYAWQSGPDPLLIDGRPCGSGATDFHPRAVASDGRIALEGGYESAVPNIDAIESGSMPKTASILEGSTCHVLDSVSAHCTALQQRSSWACRVRHNRENATQADR